MWQQEIVTMSVTTCVMILFVNLFFIQKAMFLTKKHRLYFLSMKTIFLFFITPQIILSFILQDISLSTKIIKYQNTIDELVEIDLDSLTESIINSDTIYFNYFNKIFEFADLGLASSIERENKPYSYLMKNNLRASEEMVALMEASMSEKSNGYTFEKNQEKVIDSLSMIVFSKDFTAYLKMMDQLGEYKKNFERMHPIVKQLSPQQNFELQQILYQSAINHPLGAQTRKIHIIIDDARIAEGKPPIYRIGN